MWLVLQRNCLWSEIFTFLREFRKWLHNFFVRRTTGCVHAFTVLAHTTMADLSTLDPLLLFDTDSSFWVCDKTPQNVAIHRKMPQNAAICRKAPQFPANHPISPQNAAKRRNNTAKRCITLHNTAKCRKMPQNAAKRRNLTQFDAICRNSLQNATKRRFLPQLLHNTAKTPQKHLKTLQNAAKCRKTRKTPQNAANCRKTLFCTTSSPKTWNLACNWDVEHLGTVIHDISPTQNSFPTHLG